MNVIEVFLYIYRINNNADLIHLVTNLGEFHINGDMSSKDVGNIHHEVDYYGNKENLLSNHESNNLEDIFLFESRKFKEKIIRGKYSLEEWLTKIFEAKEEVLKKRKEEVLKKLQPFIVKDTSGFLEKLKWRVDNQYWLRHSQRIAIIVLSELKNKNILYQDLSEKTEIPLEEINKIVKGSENLTIETIAKLEKALEIDILTYKL